MPKTFTLEEARALLPEVREIVAAMQADKRAFDQERDLLQEAGGKAGGNGHGPAGALTAQAEAERHARSIQERVNNLAALGVEVKGIDEGLVDFPSVREDRVVYLCWRAGEEDILFWHELDAGFRGREPLT